MCEGVNGARATYWEGDLEGEGEDNLGYTLVGREVDPAATALELGGDIRVQGTAVPTCVIQQRSDIRYSYGRT